MFRSEKGMARETMVIIVLVVLIFAAIIVRVLVGEDGLIQRFKEDRDKKENENNIVIELTDSSNK